MKLSMTEGQIRNDLATAKNPYSQVKILADLNAVSVNEMKKYLTGLGIMPKRPYKKKAENKPAEKKAQNGSKTVALTTDKEPETKVEPVVTYKVTPEEITAPEKSEPETVTVNDPVNRPAHYTDGKIEVIEYIEDKKLGFCLGNAIKYISRAGKKDPSKEIEDLEKAIWYIEHYIAHKLNEVE